MAVKLEGAIQRFSGHSDDPKPVQEGQESKPLPPGSSFLETDTGRIWRWTGLEWRLPPDGESGVLDELRTHTLLLQQILETLNS